MRIVAELTCCSAESRADGVHFCEERRYEAYGTVSVFDDRYGNGWGVLPLTR